MSGISTDPAINQLRVGAIEAADERRVDRSVGERVNRIEVLRADLLQDVIRTDEVDGEVIQQEVAHEEQLNRIGRAEVAELRTEQFAALREAIRDFIETQQIEADEVEKQQLVDLTLDESLRLDQVTEENLRLAISRAEAVQANTQPEQPLVGAPPVIAITQQVLRDTEPEQAAQVAPAPTQPTVDPNRLGTSPELFERVFAAPIGQAVVPQAAAEFSPVEQGPEEVLERPPQNPINSQDQGTQTFVGNESNADSHGNDPQTTSPVDTTITTAPPLQAASPRVTPLTSFNPDTAIREFGSSGSEEDDNQLPTGVDNVS